MSSQPSILEPPPKNASFDTGKTANPTWQRWMNRVFQVVNDLSGQNLTIGNGSPGNMQAKAKGTGTGPSVPTSVVAWEEVTKNGTTYYRPLFQ
jgi:hypothetical protein